jgi:hypothetical protein
MILNARDLDFNDMSSSMSARRSYTNSRGPSLVMPGLVPGIHVLNWSRSEDVDGRDEPGHDVTRVIARDGWYYI